MQTTKSIIVIEAIRDGIRLPFERIHFDRSRWLGCGINVMNAHTHDFAYVKRGFTLAWDDTSLTVCPRKLYGKSYFMVSRLHRTQFDKHRGVLHAVLPYQMWNLCTDSICQTPISCTFEMWQSQNFNIWKLQKCNGTNAPSPTYM